MKNAFPLVSILCLTYNQRGYVEQMIDSLLMQKTNFSYEIIINDDASSDGTKEILEDYAKKYSNIRIVGHKENQYQKGKRNMIPRFLFPLIRGRYVALCDGDDFWTDDNKLQKQVDFMEKNNDYSLVFHPVKVFFEKGEIEDSVFPNIEKGFSTKRLLEENFIHTNSVMYRARSLGEYSKIPLDVVPSDWYLHLFHAQFGKIGFIDGVMSSYRRHEGGIWWGDHKEDFWKKNAEGHIQLFVKLIDIYGRDPVFNDIILKNLHSIVSETRVINPKDRTIILKRLFDNHPEVVMVLLDMFSARENSMKTEIHKLRAVAEEEMSKTDQYRRLVNNIRSSRVWKARNKLAKYVGKEPV